MGDESRAGQCHAPLADVKVHGLKTEKLLSPSGILPFISRSKDMGTVISTLRESSR